MTQEEKRLQALVKAQGEQIEIYKKLAKNYEELVANKDGQIKELRQKFADAQWIAIFEFLTLFTETKGEIVNSSYVRSAFENIGITLNEETLISMGEYAQKHFKRDEEYTKQNQVSSNY